MANERVTLVENASATGSALLYKGGRSVFMAEATFGGGTVKLQMKTPNGTWVDVAGASLTAAGVTAGLYLAPGEYRANIATATAVYAYLAGAE